MSRETEALGGRSFTKSTGIPPGATSFTGFITTPKPWVNSRCRFTQVGFWS